MGDSKMVIGGSVILYSYTDLDAMLRVCVCAKLPQETAPDWEHAILYVINWKIEGDHVTLTYQLRNDPRAPILEATLAVVKESSRLLPPSKSRNWKLQKFSECWFNTKTGERVYV